MPITHFLAKSQQFIGIHKFKLVAAVVAVAVVGIGAQASRQPAGPTGRAGSPKTTASPTSTPTASATTTPSATATPAANPAVAPKSTATPTPAGTHLPQALPPSPLKIASVNLRPDSSVCSDFTLHTVFQPTTIARTYNTTEAGTANIVIDFNDGESFAFTAEFAKNQATVVHPSFTHDFEGDANTVIQSFTYRTRSLTPNAITSPWQAVISPFALHPWTPGASGCYMQSSS